MKRGPLVQALEDVQRRFFEDPFRVYPETELSDLADEAVLEALGPAFERRPNCAVLAAGGYGRQTLHPSSDLDFLFLFRDAGDEAVAREFRDRLKNTGFEIGYQIKAPGDFLVFDPDQVDGYTAFFGARYLWGDVQLAEEFARQVFPEFVGRNRRAVLRAMIEARAKRYVADRMGTEAPEPNVKTGVGGLRDHHFVCWVSEVLGTEPSDANADAIAFLHRVRNFLHYLSERDENVLKLEYQEGIGMRLGYRGDSAASLMRDYRRFANAVFRSSVDAESEALHAAK